MESPPDPRQDERGAVLAELGASAPRRLFALAVVYGLGLLLAALALTPDLLAATRGVLLAAAALTLWAAERMRRGTRARLLLTRQGLWTDTGVPVAPMAQIRRVDRGLFAFKPSNGFVVILAEPLPRVWVPGLWWRMGRRVGVGGVTSGHAARAMADRLTLLLHERRDGV